MKLRFWGFNSVLVVILVEVANACSSILHLKTENLYTNTESIVMYHVMHLPLPVFPSEEHILTSMSLRTFPN